MSARNRIRELAKHNAGQLLDLQCSLAEIRQRKGLSQEEVADRMGKTLETVKELEKYDTFHQLSSRTLLKYASAVGAKLQIYTEET